MQGAQGSELPVWWLVQLKIDQIDRSVSHKDVGGCYKHQQQRTHTERHLRKH